MKFQRFLLILYFVSIAASTRILTDEENKKRLDTCGQAIDITENEVISFATGPKTYTTATFISPRHILTSANLVLSSAGYWIGTKDYYNEKLCSEERIAWLQVPKNAFTHLNFGFNGQIKCENDKCKQELLEIENGFLFCNKNWNTNSYLLVLVTKTDYEVLWPCLRTDEVLIVEGTPLDLYEHSSVYKELWNDTVKVIETGSRYVMTTFPTKTRYGNGVLITQQYPHELIAMGGYATNSVEMYQDVRTLHNAFCAMFNICPRKGAALPQPKTGKLTEEEDSLRKKNCRNAGDSAYGVAKYSGLAKYYGIEQLAVTLISPRHVLMSTHSILRPYQLVATNNCEKVEKDLVKIDLEILPGLELYVAGVSLKPVAGVVICNKEAFAGLAGMFGFPMIVEVEPSNDNISTPCLPDRVLDFRKSQVEKPRSFLYVFRKEGKEFFHYTQETGDRHPPFIITKKIHENPKGAALLQSVNNLWYLAGMCAGEHQQNFWYFDIQWSLEDLCELAGICQPVAAPPTTEAPAPPTTDAPSTTVSPTPSPTETPTTETAVLEKSTMESQVATEETTTEESTSEKLTSSKASETSTNSPESTMAPESSSPEEESASLEPMEPIPVIDLDEEFREFQERQEKEDRGDWDEWGNDFYRSADFFQSSGRRIELFVGFLMVIMVVWRMVLI